MKLCRLLGRRRQLGRPALRPDPKFDEAQERLREVNDRAAKVLYRLGRDDWPDMVADIYRGGQR